MRGPPVWHTDVEIIASFLQFLCNKHKWVSRFKSPLVPVKERVSLGWGKCRGSKAQQASARIAPSRRSQAGWMPAKTDMLSVNVGRKHPVTMCKASLMMQSIRRV